MQHVAFADMELSSYIELEWLQCSVANLVTLAKSRGRMHVAIYYIDLDTTNDLRSMWEYEKPTNTVWLIYMSCSDLFLSTNS